MPPSHLRSTLFVFFFSSCSRVFLSRLFFCLQITLLFDRVSKKRWYKPRICIFLYKFFCHFFLYLKHAMSNQRVHLFGYFRLQGLIRHGMLINPIIVLLWNHEMKTKTGEKKHQRARSHLTERAFSVSDFFTLLHAVSWWLLRGYTRDFIKFYTVTQSIWLWFAESGPDEKLIALIDYRSNLHILFLSLSLFSYFLRFFSRSKMSRKEFEIYCSFSNRKLDRQNWVSGSPKNGSCFSGRRRTMQRQKMHTLCFRKRFPRTKMAVPTVVKCGGKRPVKIEDDIDRCKISDNKSAASFS